jgi:predicted  nucleic acid-binding Zn-ribbon protein
MGGAGMYFAFYPVRKKENLQRGKRGSMMKTVDQLVSEWTEEEREKLRDLIEESREREKRLLENSKRNSENIMKLDESLQSLFSSFREIKETTEKMADDLLGVYLRMYNKPMPSS